MQCTFARADHETEGTADIGSMTHPILDSQVLEEEFHALAIQLHFDEINHATRLGFRDEENAPPVAEEPEEWEQPARLSTISQGIDDELEEEFIAVAMQLHFDEIDRATHLSFREEEEAPPVANEPEKWEQPARPCTFAQGVDDGLDEIFHAVAIQMYMEDIDDSMHVNETAIHEGDDIPPLEDEPEEWEQQPARPSTMSQGIEDELDEEINAVTVQLYFDEKSQAEHLRFREEEDAPPVAEETEKWEQPARLNSISQGVGDGLDEIFHAVAIQMYMEDMDDSMHVHESANHEEEDTPPFEEEPEDPVPASQVIRHLIHLNVILMRRLMRQVKHSSSSQLVLDDVRYVVKPNPFADSEDGGGKQPARPSPVSHGVDDVVVGKQPSVGAVCQSSSTRSWSQGKQVSPQLRSSLEQPDLRSRLAGLSSEEIRAHKDALRQERQLSTGEKRHTMPLYGGHSEQRKLTKRGKGALRKDGNLKLPEPYLGRVARISRD